MQAQADSIVQFLSDENLVKQLKQEKAQNLPWLQREHNIGSEQIDALYQYAKFQFDCGNYSEAAEFLYHYRTLSTNSERNLSALWGKLAAEILLQDWETAMDSLTKLKSVIDDNNFAPLLVQLQQRTWLMHWSLFVFFNHENGRNAIIDLFFQERFAFILAVFQQKPAATYRWMYVCVCYGEAIYLSNKAAFVTSVWTILQLGHYIIAQALLSSATKLGGERKAFDNLFRVLSQTLCKCLQVPQCHPNKRSAFGTVPSSGGCGQQAAQKCDEGSYASD